MPIYVIIDNNVEESCLYLMQKKVEYNRIRDRGDNIFIIEDFTDLPDKIKFRKLQKLFT